MGCQAEARLAEASSVESGLGKSCSTESCSTESCASNAQGNDSYDSRGTCGNSEVSCGNAIPELDLPRERRRVKPWEDAPLELRLASENQSETQPETQSGSSVSISRPSVPDRIPRRWDRLVRLLGESSVKKLLGSHVTVFGLGGVGGPAVEALARSAIGRLTIVDFDDVCVTNVNRQIQAFPTTVGQSKADLLAQRIKAINPDLEVDAVQAFYDPTTAKALLTPKPDFVLDAIDNVTAKLHLLENCLRSDIPVVSVAGAGARLDPTMIRVDDLSRTRNDPLAKVMRKEFVRRGYDLTKEVGLPVVFSQEEPNDPEPPSWDKEGFRCICPHAEDSPHECEKRRLIYGTASFVTGAFGLAAASVVVKGLTNGKISSPSIDAQNKV